jgi:signal transduction histidine kinase
VEFAQEALSNALKYAHGNRTVAEVRYNEREISVEVGTGGSGNGRGAGDGFVVRARIPAGSPS